MYYPSFWKIFIRPPFFCTWNQSAFFSSSFLQHQDHPPIVMIAHLPSVRAYGIAYLAIEYGPLAAQLSAVKLRVMMLVYPKERKPPNLSST
jgi:hypothetical protein